MPSYVVAAEGYIDYGLSSDFTGTIVYASGYFGMFGDAAVT